MDKPKDNDLSSINVDVGTDEQRGINVDVGLRGNQGGDARSEATSKETTRSVNSNEDQKGEGKGDDEASGAAPSPDGQFDGSRGGQNDAGPM